MSGKWNRWFPICGRLFINQSRWNTIERHLQLCLNKIQKWADENGFKFSQSKIVSMHFCNLRKLHHEPTLTLNGLAIPVVQEHKFLGVIFDNKL